MGFLFDACLAVVRIIALIKCGASAVSVKLSASTPQLPITTREVRSTWASSAWVFPVELTRNGPRLRTDDGHLTAKQIFGSLLQWEFLSCGKECHPMFGT